MDQSYKLQIAELGIPEIKRPLFSDHHHLHQHNAIKLLHHHHHDHNLSITDCKRNLGIWITSTLCPSLQCQKVYAKAMQSLATTKRSFKYIIKESFKILYKTYIWPYIEYCVQAWSPYYAKDIDMLENIQHRATNLIPQLANLPYVEHIQNLNMYSLYCRRERGDLIETFATPTYHFYQIIYSTTNYFHKRTQV